MKTLEFLAGPSAALFWPGVIAGLCIAVQGAALSVLVVLKRMAFIGQGVSHAAFGGVGVAAALGVAGGLGFGVVGAFCILAAWAIAWASERPETSGGAEGERRAGVSTDTVIGVALVASMALGALLIAWRARHGGAGPAPSWEQALFGSILAVGPADARLAALACGVTLLALWWWRRPLLFCAFDAVAAEAGGAPTRAMRYLLLTLLAAAVVSSMKLAGVVLATALLTLPGATALLLSARLGRVLLFSLAAALAGMLGGLVAAFEFDLPPGACVVATLVGLYALALTVGGRARRSIHYVAEAG